MKNMFLAAMFCLCFLGISYGQKEKDKTDRPKDSCSIDKGFCDRGKGNSDKEKGKEDKPEPKNKPEPKGKDKPLASFRVQNKSFELADKNSKVVFAFGKQQFESQNGANKTQIL